MGAAESKSNQRYRPNKHLLTRSSYKNKPLVIEHQSLSKRRNETIRPLVTSSPLNPNLQGKILNHSFPMQRSHSEIQITPLQNEITEHLNQFEHSKGVYDYRKHMQRVDEENRPVLEGLCPDKMYVSTNDLRLCDTQRLPPPLYCKTTQGFFRPITPAQFHQKKNTFNTLFL